MSKQEIFIWFLLASVLGEADGHLFARHVWCRSNSTDLHDMVLIDAFIFNQITHLQYNSTVGKYEGYTELGVRNAERFNNNTAQRQLMNAQLDSYCRENAKEYGASVYDKTVEPEIEVKMLKQSDGSHPARLMCSAYSFYPPNIVVTWLKNGKELKSDVTSTEEMADGDWYYQVHSYLEYTPKSGEEIACVVDHASSKKPYVYKWEPSLSDPDKIMIGTGVSGLLLGLVLPAAGYVYYRKKPTGGWDLVLC